MPYDATSYYDTSQSKCEPSPAYQQGAAGYNQLTKELGEAKAAGLVPEIVFGSGTGIANASTGEPVPSVPDPIYGTPSNPFAGWTTAGLDYACGVASIMNLVSAGANAGSWLAPYAYEAANEPDGLGQANANNGGYNGSLQNACTTSSKDCGPLPSGVSYNQGGYLCGAQLIAPRNQADCGPLEAAGLWDLASYEMAVNASQRGSSYKTAPVDAGTLNTPGTGYWNGYLSVMALVGAPSEYSVHDYDDPTSSAGRGLQNLNRLFTTIASVAPPPGGSPQPGGYHTWGLDITEAGVQLDNDSGTQDLNRGAQPADPDHENLQTNGGQMCPTGCEPATSIGNWADDSAAAQRTGAQTWLSMLGQESPDTEIVVDSVNWYGYHQPTVLHNFDSDLVDTRGAARASYCVLYGSGCNQTGSSTDYQDAYPDTTVSPCTWRAVEPGAIQQTRTC